MPAISMQPTSSRQQPALATGDLLEQQRPPNPNALSAIHFMIFGFVKETDATRSKRTSARGQRLLPGCQALVQLLGLTFVLRKYPVLRRSPRQFGQILYGDGCIAGSITHGCANCPTFVALCHTLDFDTRYGSSTVRGGTTIRFRTASANHSQYVTGTRVKIVFRHHIENRVNL